MLDCGLLHCLLATALFLFINTLFFFSFFFLSCKREVKGAKRKEKGEKAKKIGSYLVINFRCVLELGFESKACFSLPELELDMVSESWFRSLWRSSKKHDISHGNAEIGVLAFELASLMSKLVNLWESLGDKQVAKLREEIMNAVGIRKLVSDDEDHIVKLMSMELMENLSHVARTVARISKKCNDPVLKSFEQAFNDICRIGVDPYGWLLTMKKMEKNIEKMKRLIVYTADLYQEIESLKGLEQMLWRMKCSDDVDSISLVEYQKKIAWKQQEIKHLKRISIWNRTYDYMVLLFASSLFTIFCKTGHVFGIDFVGDMRVNDSPVLESIYIRHGRSAAFTQSSVHPSGPIIGRRNKKNSHYSAPLGSSLATSTSISAKHDIINFYSGPLVKTVTKSGKLAKSSKSGFRLWHWQVKIPFSKHSKKLKTSGGPFNVNMDLNYGSNEEEVLDFHTLGKRIPGYQTIFTSRNRLLNAPVETLGGAALALHYANIIIVIEKLVASPHLISENARDDLYNMLPASIRVALTAKLKPYAKILTCSVYDKVLATEWNECMSGILEWLAPLAHNMIRWQSERSFEHHQNSVSRTNVLLVQTLYFANQEKTEATVTELLLGLNYVSRYGKELHAAAMMDCDSGISIDDYLES